MYIYRSVEIPHSMWSGKPTENIESILNHYGQHNWRLSAMNSGVRGAKTFTILLLEKEVGDDYYNSHQLKPLPPEYDPEDFV